MRISTQKGDPGYDPDAYNKNIKIFCNGTHIPTAHTADTAEDVVLYYEQDGRGRIKTKEAVGKVVIEGLDTEKP